MTPRVDPHDDIRGFIYDWILELADNVDKLVVLTPKSADMKMPENVKIYNLTSLNKNHKRISYLLKMHKSLLKIFLKEKIDAVFSHIYPDFTLAAALYAKIRKIPIITWYTHRQVSHKLRIATFLSDKVVSASKSSFRINTHKLEVLGHGINTDKFRPVKKNNRKIKKILCVGRIDRIKDYETLIEAVNLLVNQDGFKDFKINTIGNIYDKKYFNELKNLIKQSKVSKYFNFLGLVPHNKIPQHYQNTDLFVHCCNSGVDKALLEAMACEIPVISCAEAFTDILVKFPKCLFEPGNSKDLAGKIQSMLEQNNIQLGKDLRHIVVENHSTKSLAKKLVKLYEEL
jgi:glycosyltransferase involved in cell wall biosynthesis